MNKDKYVVNSEGQIAKIIGDNIIQLIDDKYTFVGTVVEGNFFYKENDVLELPISFPKEWRRKALKITIEEYTIVDEKLHSEEKNNV